MEDVICVPHCVNVFCKTAPESCPQCGLPINYQSIKQPSPFYPKSPFVDGHSHKNAMSVVLKPTTEVWEKIEDPKIDLHIGITDNDCKVISYSQLGVTTEDHNWDSSIVVYKTDPGFVTQWENIWKEKLLLLESNIEWRQENYNENSHNCFDFVIVFLNSVKQDVFEVSGKEYLNDFKLLESSSRSERRKQFIREHILPKINQAVRYIHLYKKVEEFGFAVLDD